jgi:predicted O-methyltransferase YrrM
MNIYIIKDNIPKDIYNIFIKNIDKNTLPNINFNTKQITFNIPFYNKIISKKHSFNQNLYKIKYIFGAFVSNDIINISDLEFEPCNINYKIKVKSNYKIGQLINHSQYTPNNRRLLETTLQIFKPTNICFYNSLSYSKYIIATCQTLNKYNIKLNIHSFGKYYYPLNNPKLIEKNNDLNLHLPKYNDLNYKYLRLNYSINNITPYADTNNIIIYGQYDIVDTIIYLISEKIKVDFFVIEYINNVQILKQIINKLYYINPNIVIYINTNDIDTKKFIVNELNPFNILNIKGETNVEKSLSPLNNSIHSYIITNNYFDYNIISSISPISNFYDYKFINITDPHPNYYVSKYNYDINKDYISSNKSVPITSKWLHNNFKYIYDKYKTELDLLNKYINNEYIYNIHYSRVIFINELCFFLNSNINQYECIFLNNIIKNYIKTHPKKIYNIFEIGCAYGTSGMIISNIFTKIKNTLNFWSIDPNQRFQWHNIGDYNINNIIKQSPYKNINWNLIEQYSHESIQYLQSLNIHFDICFIDGAHDFINVYGDIVLTDSILNINGIIILDDIKHDGVKESVLYFFKHNDRYKRIYFNDNLELQYTKSLYTYNKSTKSFTNPDTMYAFIKLF